MGGQPMYVFKMTPEFWWAILVAVVGAVATAVATQGSVPPTDWRAWAVGIVVALVRVIGGVVLAQFAASRPQ